MQKIPVIQIVDGERAQAIDKEGRAIWKFDSAGANSALEKLGKYFKLFTDKVEAEQNSNVTFVMEDHPPVEKWLNQYQKN